MKRTEQGINVYMKGSSSNHVKKYLPILEITTISALAIVLSATSMSIPINQATATGQGQPGGPRQIPGEIFGCHFPNPAGNVNTNPHCLSQKPPIPDCQTIETGSQDYPCRSSSPPTAPPPPRLGH